MFLSQSSVSKLYTSVIDDVISGVREAFLDEGVDEQVLQELRQVWEGKLMSSKALEQPEPPEPQPPLINSQKAVATKPLGQSAGNAAQLAMTDLSKPVPIQITLPAQVGSPNTQPRTLTIQVPASALQGNQLHSLLTGTVISATMALPTHVAEAVLQSHVTANLQGQAMSGSLQLQQQQQQHQQHQQHQQQQQPHQTSQQVFPTSGLSQETRQPFATHHQMHNSVPQLDGQHDSSDDDDDDEEEEEDNDDDDNEDDKDEEENDENDAGAEEEPLNSEDDVSEEDPGDMFDTDNVVVCQYDKITRSRNKWKFYLKDGIMNLSGKDFVFQKANGDAEW